MVVRFSIALLAFVTTASSALASIEGRVSARGSVVSHSPGYYSGDTGTFEISFETKGSVPASVALRLAYEGRNSDGKSANWANENVLEMKKITATKWVAVFADPVAARGALRYSKLNFVFLVRATPYQRHVQTGTENGSGFYQVEVPFGHADQTDLRLSTQSN